MSEEYWEWDGESHIGDEVFKDFITEERWKDAEGIVIESFCDCFHLKGCCNLTFNGEKMRAGDRIYYRNNTFELVRGDTEPFICPTHNVEHSGTGRFICMTTGEFV